MREVYRVWKGTDGQAVGENAGAARFGSICGVYNTFQAAEGAIFHIIEENHPPGLVRTTRISNNRTQYKAVFYAPPTFYIEREELLG